MRSCLRLYAGWLLVVGWYMGGSVGSCTCGVIRGKKKLSWPFHSMRKDFNVSTTILALNIIAA